MQSQLHHLQGMHTSRFLRRQRLLHLMLEGRLCVLGVLSRRAASAEAIGDKIEGLKRGRTEVLEAGHTLILGWSDKMLNMIDQLCLANQSAGGKAIVILAERDKQDMEYDIHKQIHNLRGSRILCRWALRAAHRPRSPHV